MLHKVVIPLLHNVLANGEVPPATTTQALPLFCPQFELVADATAVNRDGSVKVNVKTVGHEPFDVIVTVCPPAHKLFTKFPDCKPGCHKNVVVPAPPEKATFAVPSHTPLHFALVVVKVVANGAGSMIVAFVVTEHPLVSVTVTL